MSKTVPFSCRPGKESLYRQTRFTPRPIERTRHFYAATGLSYLTTACWSRACRPTARATLRRLSYGATTASIRSHGIRQRTPGFWYCCPPSFPSRKPNLNDMNFLCSALCFSAGRNYTIFAFPNSMPRFPTMPCAGKSKKASIFCRKALRIPSRCRSFQKGQGLAKATLATASKTVPDTPPLSI